MKYLELIKLIEGRAKFPQKPGLHRIKALLKEMGNPQSNLKYIHVAGTNGKGSTCKFIYSILREANIKVGLFTSPHLNSYCERIIVDDNEISEEEFTNLGLEIINIEKGALKESEELTIFEFLTIISFLYFNEKKCQLVVLETGLGGLLDSTNVISSKESLIQVITSIGYDHVEILGKSVQEITSQKSGIIKENSKVLVGSVEKVAHDIIENKVKEEKSEVIFLKNKDIKIINVDEKSTIFSFKSGKKDYHNLLITQGGVYQSKNAALSILIAEELISLGYKIREENIYCGLENMRWQGRFELISTNPKIIIDGAHNQEGIKALLESLDNLEFSKLYIVAAILKDKEHEDMINILAKKADVLILTNVRTERNFGAKDLYKEIEVKDKILVFDSVKEALIYLKDKLKDSDLGVITGSLYLMGELKEILKNL